MGTWKGWIAIGSIVTVASCGTGADPAAGEDSSVPPEALQAAPALPLRTLGKSVLDARGSRVKISAVTWSGAEGREYVVTGLDRQSLRDMVTEARQAGVNAVRLPWSNELVLLGALTTVDPARVAKNPDLKGKTGMEAFDAVVRAVTSAGMLVILDNRSSDAGRPNPRWVTADYPEERWIADWKAMARRYAKNPLVVGVELRSGMNMRAVGQEWASAAEHAAEAVLSVSPHLLVSAGGVPIHVGLTGRVLADPIAEP